MKNLKVTNEQARDLKLQAKKFAVRIIRMYSKSTDRNNVAQGLGKRALRAGTFVSANCREAARSLQSRVPFQGRRQPQGNRKNRELAGAVPGEGLRVGGKMAGLPDNTRQLIAGITISDKIANN